MNFGAWIFFIVVVVGLIWSVKNKRITKLGMSLFLVIVLVYYLIAYIFNNEILSPFIFKGDSFTISFVGVILLFGTYHLLKYVINKFWEISG
ncbi:putative MAPEG superfamily protein [Metabacillus crassostreae]|uniref:hypothetical protein n=1 Tax=Metabacillus crassostreae TaxID=929098 RepID=UPI001957E1D7|nr:hypothetical protein [Metabacillus crassostreae]MBM7602724.1 putative MAPEG superfamily protein [Metabacillus crassostreae]